MDPKQPNQDYGTLQSIATHYALSALLQYEAGMDTTAILQDLITIHGHNIFAPSYCLVLMQCDQTRPFPELREKLHHALHRAFPSGNCYPFSCESDFMAVITGGSMQKHASGFAWLVQEMRSFHLRLFVSSVSTEPGYMRKLHHDLSIMRDFSLSGQSVIYQNSVRENPADSLSLEDVESELYRLVEKQDFFAAVTMFDQLIDLQATHKMSMAQLRKEVHFRVIQLRRVAHAEYLDAELADSLRRIDSAENIRGLKEGVYDAFAALEDGTQTRRSWNKKLSAILKYIEQSFDDPTLNAAMLCKAFHLSPGYLSRIFKQGTGCGVIEYLNKQRIEMAKSLLSNTDLPIEKIAAQVGFSNRGTFMNAFKRYERITPGQYRQRCQL